MIKAVVENVFNVIVFNKVAFDVKFCQGYSARTELKYRMVIR